MLDQIRSNFNFRFRLLNSVQLFLCPSGSTPPCDRAFWSFVEKTSIKQDLKRKVCKFSDVVFALTQTDGPPVDEALSQVDIFVKSLNQTDLWSDVPTPKDQVWDQDDIFVRSSGHADLWSDVPLPQAQDLWSHVPPPPRSGFGSG